MNTTETKVIRITNADKPFTCPPKDADRASLHPRVFLPLDKVGDKAKCFYCGAAYSLEE